MSVRLAFITVARSLAALMMLAALVFQSACAAVPTAAPGKAQGDSAGKSHNETAFPVTPLAETAVSPPEIEQSSDVFSGTVAATPDIAGVSAMVKQHYPGRSVAQMQSFLEDEAIDLGTSGKDNLYGGGRLYLPVQNVPPYTPSSPSPADGATGVSTTTDLSWTGGDPNAGDPVIYDVYFGTSDPPTVLLCNDVSSTTCDPGTLSNNTHYYWRVDATDNYGASTSGPVWDFTTGSSSNNPPNTPRSPSPADGVTGVSTTADLSWTGGDPDSGDTVIYDVYLEANDSTPDILVCNDVATPSCDPGTLGAGVQYYWRVNATDNHGASTSGPVWDFTTSPPPNNPPYAPASPSPADGTKGVSITADLSWIGGDPDSGDTVTYDVYFGTSDPATTLICNDVSSTTCDPGILSPGTHYYWRVDATDSHGASTSGGNWDFATGAVIYLPGVLREYPPYPTGPTQGKTPQSCLPCRTGMQGVPTTYGLAMTTAMTFAWRGA
jgi:hypothetical protein